MDLTGHRPRFHRQRNVGVTTRRNDSAILRGKSTANRREKGEEKGKGVGERMGRQRKVERRVDEYDFDGGAVSNLGKQKQKKGGKNMMSFL